MWFQPNALTGLDNSLENLQNVQALSCDISVCSFCSGDQLETTRQRPPTLSPLCVEWVSRQVSHSVPGEAGDPLTAVLKTTLVNTLSFI